MSACPLSQQVETFDILGCGFGPANLGIAVALVDKSASHQVKHNTRAIFVEKHPEFQWHPGMLLPRTRMQISCLKDLATLRNPSSPFTFLSYLHSQNRLSAFINRGSTFPTRREFADYLAWAAHEVVRRGVRVVYAEEIVAISKILDGEQELIEVTSRRSLSDELVVRRTKHIVLSAGGSPRLPRALSYLQPAHWIPESVLSMPVLHTTSYMTLIRPLLAQLGRTGAPLKVAVIGGGQSSAECLLDMHSRLEALSSGGHQIDMIFRKGSLKPSDDSPFVNEIFDPATTDVWYNLPSDRLRDSILYEYKNTNYSVVNPATLNNLYELIYDQKLSDSIAEHNTPSAGTPNVRVSLRVYENVIGALASSTKSTDDSAAPQPQRITLTRQHVHTRTLVEDTYDAVVCGTGYDRIAWLRLLRASNLGREFGLAGAAAQDAPVRLIPAHYAIERETEPEADVEDLKEATAPVHEPEHEPEHDHTSMESMSSPTTPPSSPSLSLSLAPHALPAPVPVRISRAYRLLPLSLSAPGAQEKESRNRVYVQGCAEATHGLSDTLLSVIGVRAGEVVDDLWDAEWD